MSFLSQLFGSVTARYARAGDISMRTMRRWLGLSALALAATFVTSDVARAEDAASAASRPISGADTAFVLISAALVMFMTPGLGLFYGGMVRRKNVLATFQQSFILLGVISLQWIFFGYSLAFSPGPGALNDFVGGLTWIGLNGVELTPHTTYAPTIPHQLFMVYQLMFAAITPALISGAFAERMKFSAYLVFTLLWATLVYDPVAHWVWGGGWIAKLGALDFAGGLVVHVISGIAALCCVLVIGQRKGYGNEEMHPHNLTMTTIGTALLWFGWFGFNAGSALGANAAAVAAFVNTNTAAATAATVWCAIEWFHKGKATVLGACTGAVAGLVAVTPAAGYVTPMGAILIGTLVCFACYSAILLKGRFGYDDSLDVFGVHGVGGALGALAVGLLAKASVSGGANGLFFGGGFAQLGKQALSLVVAAVYSFVVTFVILKVVDRLIGLRVSADDEEVGLDLSQHGERGYIMGVGELMGGQPSHGHGHAYNALPPLYDHANRPAADERILT
jgi:ammonium transporter, Amt family